MKMSKEVTLEELAKRKEELREAAEEQVKIYNDAIQTGNFEEAHKADENIQQAINEYTSIARSECFDECAATDDPMFEAVKKLRYETIAIKDTRVGDEKIPVRSIVERDYSINLLHLNKYVKGGIGADKKWAHAAQKLNFLLTAQKAKDLGIDPRIVHDSYAMSEIAEKIDMGKTPTSKSNLLRTLQTVITAMLGEGVKATSHDVNFLMSIYSRKNRRALTVTCANHSHFVGYLAEICNHIVTGASYELDFRRK